jgi:hypothetical protein
MNNESPQHSTPPTSPVDPAILRVLRSLDPIARAAECPYFVAGATGAIRQPLQPALLVTLKNLVAGLARNAELSAQGGHTFPILEPDHKAHAFVHNRTFLPWHPTSRPLAGEKV